MINSKRQISKRAWLKRSYKISLIYLSAGLIWILFSDKFVSELNLSTNELTYYQSAKGFVFVFTTAILLFVVLYKDTKNIFSVHNKLKKEEEKFASFLENIPGLVYIKNFERKHLYVNKTFEEKLKVNREDIYLKTLEEKLGASIRSEAIIENDQIILKEKRSTQYEVDLILDNETRTFLTTKFPIEINDDILIGGVSVDITERKKVERDLLDSKNRLQELTAHLHKVREEERASIAREIHDELGQVLTSLKMNISLINRELIKTNKYDINDLENELTSMMETIDDSVKRVRKLITNLRPEILDKLGLIPAIEWITHEFKNNTLINCNFNTNVEEIDFPSETGIVVYRILQEALTNVSRHADAKNVQVDFKVKGNVATLKVTDDGNGIPHKKLTGLRSFGIMGMRERASLIGAELNFNSKESEGTTVSLTCKIENQ